MDHPGEELLARCAELAARVRVTDLTVLAQLHSDLQSLGELLIDRPVAAAAAKQAAGLLETLVRADAGDPHGTLQQVVALIRQLQLIFRAKGVNGSTGRQAGGPAGPVDSPDGDRHT